jgi:hypothetical protein
MQQDMQNLEDDGEDTYNEKIEIDSAVEDLQGRIKQALSKDKDEPKSSAPKLDKDDDDGMSIAAANQTKFYLNKELGLDGSVDLNNNGAIEYNIPNSTDTLYIGNDEKTGKKFSVSLADEDGNSNDTYKAFDNDADAMAYAKELGQKLKGGKEEPKSQSKDSTDYTKLTTTPLVKKTKDDITKVNAVVSQFLDKADDIVKNGAEDGGKSPRKMFKKLKDYIQGLRDTNQFDDDALNKAYYYANDVSNSYEYGGDENPKDSDEDSIKNSVKKIQALIKPKNDKEEPKKDEPKDDGRPKDSTGGRAGNPEVNKAVRRKAKSLGVTAKQLGREEYERRMKKAAVETLTDSNFHSEARKLIAVLEDKPEWAKDPNQDPNKPDIFSPEYKEWEKTSVYSSDLYDSAPGTDEIAHEASQEAGWDGVSALDAIAFDLKVNGSKDLALKIQNIIDDTNESSTKLGRLLPEGLINEGTRSQVGIIDRSGKIASIYVHYDGYPRNMKPALKKHMKNEKDVLKLIKMGGASGIYADKPEVPYYKKGNGMKPLKGSNKDIYGFIDKTKDSWAEYLYLYNMKDRKWYYADTYKDKELKKLF